MGRKHITLSERDRELLGALAEQRLAVLPQVAHWLGVTEATAARRLRVLREAGLVEYERIFEYGAPAARITASGLKRAGSTLGKPGRKLDEYRHDVGVVWLWTAARQGTFGPMTEVVTERTMRSNDTRLDRLPYGERVSTDERLMAVDLGLMGSDGRPRRHYPDLLMRTRDGQTVAVELELTVKGRARLDRVMDAYASDSRFDAVLYVVPDQRTASTVRRAAQRAGIGDMVHVRQLASGGIAGVDRGRSPARAPARTLARDQGPTLEASR